MDPEFRVAAAAIVRGALADLEREVSARPELATAVSSCGHPTLLQFVACEEASVVDAVGAAKLLVAHGAETWSPIVSAAGCNSVNVLRYLLDSGAPFHADDVWTPLEEALYWASRDTTDLLLMRHAPLRSLAAAAGVGDVHAADRMLGHDPLHDAGGPIRSPFPDTVPEFLSQDAATIIDHAFVMAANTGQLEAAQLLHGAGARINQRPPGYHWHGTALHAAVWRGDRLMVAWLRSVGADPTIRDGLADADAAQWATHHGHAELLPLLGA